METSRLLIEGVGVEDIETLVESHKETKEKEYKIRGPFIMCEQKNRNGRIYPMEIVEPEVGRYITEKVKTFSAYGNIDHPVSDPTLKLMDAAIITTKLVRDRNLFLGEAKILSTPSGRVLRNLMDDGCRLAVSTRGLGSLQNGYVSSNFKLLATDAVADPSAVVAVVESIVEGVEYIVSGDQLVEISVSKLKQNLAKHGSKNLASDLHNFLQSLKTKI
jgi:hypothetical protein